MKQQWSVWALLCAGHVYGSKEPGEASAPGWSRSWRRWSPGACSQWAAAAAPGCCPHAGSEPHASWGARWRPHSGGWFLDWQEKEELCNTVRNAGKFTHSVSGGQETWGGQKMQWLRLQGQIQVTMVQMLTLLPDSWGAAGRLQHLSMPRFPCLWTGPTTCWGLNSCKALCMYPAYLSSISCYYHHSRASGISHSITHSQGI